MLNKLYLGNCLDVLPTIPSNSIDSVVSDPPYELGFMGKSWDNSGIAYNVGMWKEVLRVLKPGGHLLSFSGTRTYHRMAVAIEDAGFEIRDMIEWCYGSGFPKSLNIGKAIQKESGVQPEGFIENKDAKFFGEGWNATPRQVIMPEKEGVAKELEGWGTALKPAHEPICMARKPITERTIAKNVLKHGTGGINIDDSRVGTEVMINQPGSTNDRIAMGNGWRKDALPTESIGRFPANLIHDGSEEVVECFPNTKPTKPHGGDGGKLDTQEMGWGFKRMYSDLSDNGGSAARFFKSIIYIPKSSKRERNKGLDDLEDKVQDEDDYERAGTTNPRNRSQLLRKNFHPTVKPVALMRYLIKMVTPKDGVVLDPFAGSGSTLVAAKEEGFGCIGIEMTKDYIPIIQARTGCEVITHDPAGIRKQSSGVLDKVQEIDNAKVINKKHICPTCELWTDDNGICEYCKKIGKES